MSDPRFPRDHLARRNARLPEGWRIIPGLVLAFAVWGGLAAVILASLS